MAGLKTVTFEGTLNEKLYDMSSIVGSTNLILTNFRIDLDITDIFANQATFYANLPKSVSLEIGNTIGSSYVIDTDPDNFYLKVPLNFDYATINSRTYLIATGLPNIGYRMTHDIQRQTKFAIRNSSGVLIDPAVLKFFCFQFNAV